MLNGHDFLDFGSWKGGSIGFSMDRLGGTRGLGVETNPRNVELMRSLGYDAVHADALALDVPPNSVRFVTISHFLEHLPDLDAVRKAIGVAASAATDFLFIQGPWFDADEMLEAHDLKFYWSDWMGHRCHLTTKDLEGILNEMHLDDHILLAQGSVADSSDPCVLPMDAPRDQHDYQEGVHPPKRHVTFDSPIPRELVCVVRLRDFDDWSRVVHARRDCRPIGGTLPYPAVAASPGDERGLLGGMMRWWVRAAEILRRTLERLGPP